ncbi:hypothetical protein EO763_12460 [Pectobacterium odoriferum]|uniref:hypothetical protein n=1 Tax=Pectobacterium odoriferum TaxID=78398 RepID=UPI000C7F6DA0|nr:hypothetical protein [Pectobacterium odoriferum]PLY37332.1 hypothetical protein F164LOC_10095 [Pectobacterium carotovorum]QHP80677.1 hypothetical protein EO763_12460 [Pectobacterium odoriferum]
MSQELSLSFTENIYYSTSEPVSIKEVIASLQGWEAIVKQSEGVLREITGSHILDISVHVQRLEAGSLYEDIVVKLLFGTQEEMDKFLESVHNKIGNGKMRNTLITAVIAGLVGYGLLLASKAMNPAVAPHFEANNNTIINIGAGEANISPERLHSVIESTVTNKKSLAKNAVKTLVPARGDGNSTLQIGSDSTAIIIPSETIKQAPTEVSFDPETYTQDYLDTDVEIRALDLDNPERGWAAVIPGLVDRRIKLVLAPGINPQEFKGKFAIRADITITYRLKSTDNKYQPVEIFLKDIIK